MTPINTITAFFPSEINFNTDPGFWNMMPVEQMALIYFLQNLKPKVSIEIGTQFGGSLQVLSHFSSKVYALDIDPEVPLRLKGKYSNVEYLVGDSFQTLPVLLENLQKENAEIGFILLDGNCSTEAVKKDIASILKIKPIGPLYILIHNSFYPPCRIGICSVNWSSCPYAHALELDYIMGGMSLFGGPLMGAGIAMAILLPSPREHNLQASAWGEPTLSELLYSFAAAAP